MFPESKIREQHFCSVDLNILKTDSKFLSLWDNFLTEIVENTEECLLCMGLALHQTFYVPDLPVVRARLLSYEPILQLKQLKVEYYGK